MRIPIRRPWPLSPDVQAIQQSRKADRASLRLRESARHSRGSAGTAYNEPIAKRTTGWRATCKCPAHEPVPCTVLDPFSGAGTTALVADRLQRNAIGIELNPDYAAMGVDRVYGDAPLFADIR